ncbi:MAG: ribonuclease P protein component [Oscillospiraceae bacterium]|nr:ribonuclease P protein component [Oscillospiraceae bacterium]MBP3519945.1 ribonuclease P protein component [Oscillospiraceae bacterium]
MKHTVSMKEKHLFRRLYTKGKSVAFPTIAVYARQNGSQRSRLGFTVGTKVGKAVRRNKVRRRLREAYRIHEGEMRPGWDLVVVARVKAAHVPYRQLEKDLLRSLDKLGVRKEGDRP